MRIICPGDKEQILLKTQAALFHFSYWYSNQSSKFTNDNIFLNPKYLGVSLERTYIFTSNLKMYPKNVKEKIILSGWQYYVILLLQMYLVKKI